MPCQPPPTAWFQCDERYELAITQKQPRLTRPFRVYSSSMVTKNRQVNTDAKTHRFTT